MKPQLRFANLIVACSCLLWVTAAQSATNVFFNPWQTANFLVSNLNAVTISSESYLFTYSVDGWWSAYPGGPPTGRFQSVFWPDGIDAQAITTGPNHGSGANITIQRVDGKLFDLWALTAKLLANTAGAGGAFEIMPQTNGVDALPNPVILDATGYAGMSFPYAPALQGYDTYRIHLWVDYAITALTLIDTNPIVPLGPTNTIDVSVSPPGAGMAGGGGLYPSNSICLLMASPNPGWGFQSWTENGLQVSAATTYTFTVTTNRALVANFVPAFDVTTGVSPAFGGTAAGGGTFTSNSLVTVTATPNPGFDFVNWTEFGVPVSTSASYSFNIAGNRSLVANFTPAGVSATFDFDTGTPPVGPGQGLPATQTQNGVTAAFSTLSGGWSVQNNFFFWKPAVFSGNFLYPSTSGSSLAIEFSHPVTNFSMAFFTGEVSSEYDTAAQVLVTGYTNSAMTFPVASGSVRGDWLTGAYPEGTLSFGSATQFTKVKIEVPSQNPMPSFYLFVDNIVVQLATPPLVTITTSVAPPGAGTVNGAGPYPAGTTVTLSATANTGFHFTNWTENSTEVSTTPTYGFNAANDRTLVANFVTNLPPLAFGGSFFQLAAQPLAINLRDLMWRDYDPDGLYVWFQGVSATTSNGLPLATNATQVLVPPNNVDDSFTYTIVDSDGATAVGTATITIISNVTSQATSLDLLSIPGMASLTFTGVPWYYYQCERATNVTFTGTVHAWQVQAWADGSIYTWDDFADLASKPPQAFYRLRYP